MEFMQSGPDIVRSNHQRRLLDDWASRRGHDALPRWRGLDAGDFPVPPDNLAWMDVVTPEAGGHDGARFRMGFHGARLARALGPVEGVGRFIEDFLPPAYLNTARATYREAVRTGRPVYTLADMRDQAGRIVHHERLLLPFKLGGTGGRSDVERILMSLDITSPEGVFELRDLMTSRVRPPVFALCATIQY
jgi:hypothetical protein